MKIVIVSDTHCADIPVPDGDVLIHCGDGTFQGKIPELIHWNNWFQKQIHETKILIPGNHDWAFEHSWLHAVSLFPGINVLHDSGIQLGEFKIWGSAWQPEFNNWAFNLPRGDKLKAKWDLIPDDTNILVTHGPPYGILDELPARQKLTYDFMNSQEVVTQIPGIKLGCYDLRERINKLPNLRLHAFGHIHCAYGYWYDTVRRIHFVNGAVMDEAYDPVNPPVIVEL